MRETLRRIDVRVLTALDSERNRALNASELIAAMAIRFHRVYGLPSTFESLRYLREIGFVEVDRVETVEGRAPAGRRYFRVTAFGSRMVSEVEENR